MSLSVGSMDSHTNKSLSFALSTVHWCMGPSCSNGVKSLIALTMNWVQYWEAEKLSDAGTQGIVIEINHM